MAAVVVHFGTVEQSKWGARRATAAYNKHQVNTVAGWPMPSTHLNTQLAAAKHLPIHAVDGVVGITLVHVAHKRKAAGVPRVKVARDVHVP